jgi:hypothetical protein
MTIQVLCFICPKDILPLRPKKKERRRRKRRKEEEGKTNDILISLLPRSRPRYGSNPNPNSSSSRACCSPCSSPTSQRLGMDRDPKIHEIAIELLGCIQRQSGKIKKRYLSRSYMSNISMTFGYSFMIPASFETSDRLHDSHFDHLDFQVE